MLPDRVSNPGPLTYLTYESGALPIALRGPAFILYFILYHIFNFIFFWLIGYGQPFLF